MPNEKRVTTGLVLRQTPTKESDWILTVLTPDLGRVGVIAKGARGRKSKVSAACQLLTYSELTLTARGEWYYLDEASTVELFGGLRQDITLLALGSYFAELCEAICTAEAAPELLRLMLNALYALSVLRKNPAVVKPAFTFRLMALAGFAPYCDDCAVCGKTPEKPVLDTVQGVVHCAACKTGGLSLPLTAGALDALRYILRCEDKRLYSFFAAANDLKLLDHAAEAFTAAQLERSFRTLDYYKQVKSEE